MFYFYDWSLCMHTTSTRQTCQGVKLVIDHENLDCEDSVKYLGVVIHENLTWNEHIESLISKVNRRIRLLNRIKHLLPLIIWFYQLS